MEFDERLRYYLGLLWSVDEISADVSAEEVAIPVHVDLDAATFVDRPGDSRGARHLLKSPTKRRALLFERYVAPMQEVAREVGFRGVFAVAVGDVGTAPKIPLFCQAVPTDRPGLGVLARLNAPRYHDSFDEVDRNDVPWREKERRLLWRGATTDRFWKAAGRDDHAPRARIPQVADRAGDDPRIDVGFSKLTPAVLARPALARRLERYLAPRMSIAEQLRFRYILSLEGNDVASGLLWLLYSGSVVIMPRPSRHGWAMENALVPFRHYVPVSRSLGDLEKVLDWCDANEVKCQRIACAGREFARQFLDPRQERALMLALGETTFRKVRWTHRARP